MIDAKIFYVVDLNICTAVQRFEFTGLTDAELERRLKQIAVKKGYVLVAENNHAGDTSNNPTAVIHPAGGGGREPALYNAIKRPR